MLLQQGRTRSPRPQETSAGCVSGAKPRPPAAPARRAPSSSPAPLFQPERGLRRRICRGAGLIGLLHLAAAGSLGGGATIRKLAVFQNTRYKAPVKKNLENGHGTKCKHGSPPLPGPTAGSLGRGHPPSHHRGGPPGIPGERLCRDQHRQRRSARLRVDQDPLSAHPDQGRAVPQRRLRTHRAVRDRAGEGARAGSILSMRPRLWSGC